MGLSLYRKKRSFKNTPEPTGGKNPGASLRFVVQKHAASHLHYDFRLEMDGVLKSWAVPKGPSLNPNDKRLAMMVEDHPFDYRNFEGTIPEGNYGAGTVMLWDEGNYESLEPGNKQQQEKKLLQQLKAGSLKFRLAGTKLKGEFALVKLKSAKQENAWLLIKHRDKYAKETDVTKKNKSVVTGRTIEKISKNDPSAKAALKKTHVAAKKKAAAKKKSDPEEKIKSAFPKTFEPMLASLVDKPFEEPGWLYEIKWDGYRAIALLHKGKVELRSRNNKSFNEKFYPVTAALKKWKINAVVDGEVVVLNKKGIASFGALQNWRSEEDGELLYYVFDILWLEGYDLTKLPLFRRRELLKENMPAADDSIRFSENFETSVTTFLTAAGKMGMEGILAKKADSRYFPGARSKEWLKIKANKRHEVVIGGFTKNEDSSKTFSSLLVGVYEKDKLVYTGKIGTGFSMKTQKELMAKMKKLITTKSPFAVMPNVNKPSRFRQNVNAKATWLKPQLVCEVSYTEMTSDAVMRHPSFEGLRSDKSAKDVKKERIVKVKEVVEKK